jgi:hypothetical protein
MEEIEVLTKNVLVRLNGLVIERPRKKGVSSLFQEKKEKESMSVFSIERSVATELDSLLLSA